LIESRLSRVGEEPLLLIADQLKANLIEQGWTETPNASADAWWDRSPSKWHVNGSTHGSDADYRHRGHADAGAPVVLFRTRILGGGVDAQQGRQYDVGPDGRFLINTVLDEASAPITLLQNWNPEAKK
jgi:hypothetical protein